MNSDGRGGAVRRPRVIEQAPVPPGPLADLKKLVYELYLRAGTPSLDVITGWVAEDDSLPGAPERDTIHRIIRDNALPPSQADVVTVVSVLSRAARWDADDAAERARALWVEARLDPGLGVPLAQVTDPFALEVHRPISLDEPGELPPLPVYARRTHDDRLASVVAGVLAGESAMVVLVAGSSAGKTRACWEALEPLRAAGGWRLWHPYDPTRREAAVRALDRVGPRTVVWLNETQEYLAEEVAAKLRTLLADPARKPVLVLGTLWPEHHDTLTRQPGSQVRQVLEDTVLEVPDAFTGADLAAMRTAADSDARLAWAVEHADSGQITQVLAGGPALLERFHTAPPAAKAVLLAAMDARRLGHRNALSQSFLKHAAPEYLSDVHWGQLAPDWLARALEYACRPCKGAPGPLTRIRSMSDTRYRLADYLDQYGRAHRVAAMPPDGFWRTHVDPEDQIALGWAAAARGRYRDAAQCYKNARAVYLLLGLHDELDFDDPRWLEWSLAHVPLDDIEAVEYLLVRSAYDADPLLARDPAAHVPVDDREAVGRLLTALRDAGATEQVATLADRVVARFRRDDLETLGVLLDYLHHVGATRQAEALTRRAVELVPKNDLRAVRDLLFALQVDEAAEQIGVLLAGDPARRIPIDDPAAVADWLVCLHGQWPGATAQLAVLLARDPAAHARLDDPEAVADLLDRLHRVGAADQVAKLAERAIEHRSRDLGLSQGRLLCQLHDLGFAGQATALAEHVAAHVSLDLPLLDRLLADLHAVGAAEPLARRVAEAFPVTNQFSAARALVALNKVGIAAQAAVLARRVAEQVSLASPDGVARLLTGLAHVGLPGEAAALLAREPASQVALDDLEGVHDLLDTLRECGAEDQAEVLARRIVAEAQLDDPRVLVRQLEMLCGAGATEQLAELLDRDPAAHVRLSDWEAVWKLLIALDQLEAGEQVTALLTRAVERVPLDDADAVLRLLTTLPDAGELVARDPAAHVRLDDPQVVQQFLGQLAKIGATEQVTTLLARDPASQVTLRSGFGAHHLWTRLRMIGADDQAASLVERLSLEGKFYAEMNPGYPFGRESDGTATAPWGWDDLD